MSCNLINSFSNVSVKFLDTNYRKLLAWLAGTPQACAGKFQMGIDQSRKETATGAAVENATGTKNPRSHWERRGLLDVPGLI